MTMGPRCAGRHLLSSQVAGISRAQAGEDLPVQRLPGHSRPSGRSL